MHRRLAGVILVVAAVAMFSACQPSTPPTTTTTSTTTSTTTTMANPWIAICQAQDSSLHTAVDAYDKANGSYPASVNELIPDYLASAPTGVVLSSGGSSSQPPTYAWAGPCATYASLLGPA
jgi:hypothetical protein